MSHPVSFSYFDAPPAVSQRPLGMAPAPGNRPAPAHDLVWLIDDDAFTNFLSERTIRQQHFAREVLTLTSVEDALRLLEQALSLGTERLPNVIFLDLNMPYLDGWDFLDAFRQLPAFHKAGIALYFLSSAEEPAHLARARRSGDVHGFIAKPLSTDDLAVIRLRHEGWASK